MSTTLTPASARLIEAFRAFSAEQADLARAGLMAASEGDDVTAKACLTTISATADAIVEAVSPVVPEFEWSDRLSLALTEIVPGFDELVYIVDRDGYDEHIDVADMVAAGLMSIEVGA